ncbi:bifunctional UDP-N-acetylglucosamine diphosphorylase/glucosamine-1-phosphate N-acetyltransferase GlmU [Candidatus Dependentiae bacterium]|nr:bifunctional UDP-N-acetylglucosamine diphosphorylase/glucosamine-1-phosphate N-acetyltransferase GlmU [Candidatus Dependentiae bacterium]MBU4387183.1 bifunctional UDP-N-acetylglucosamine diphosphorylase/glucosamine-1-phosphate N-acetyltransferase GlmU [Candidatus Dependentiae bacterium]MCG2755998.1 bifunctional UDP-N-acetylglucosamine diphosphorylase/glucosamine-1-phosphate N-acetyltransferase GlmU [Candidatus Dependentiae bacterium]
MKTLNTRAIVLAAGKSSRFKTNRSKLLYSVCGQPMILYTIKLLKNLGISTTVVVGYQADEIKKLIKDSAFKVDFISQKELLGTGNAVGITKKTWDKDNILVMNGDGPLLTEEIIEELLYSHNNSGAVVTFLSSHSMNPEGYGRVIRDGKHVSIIEERNLTDEQKFVTLINSGIYLFKKKFLQDNIDNIQLDSIKKEYYLTDLVKMASDQALKVKTIPVPYDNVRGVNTLEELWAVEQIKRSQIIKHWMTQGVRFELAQSIHIDWDVEIGIGSYIGTGVHIIRGTKIGSNCTINAFCIIDNCQIDDNSYIHSHTVVQDSKIGKNSHVGPFARLRNNVVIGNNVNIGNFVEIKNSEIADDSSAKHLTYLGDSTIGKNVNIGAGTITCNYDGVNKHRTEIKDGVFIGSNNTLVAPVVIEKDAYTAAGSTITKDVPKESLAIARARQENKVGYAKKLKNKNKKETESSVSSSVHKEKRSKLNFVGAVKPKSAQNL